MKEIDSSEGSQIYSLVILTGNFFVTFTVKVFQALSSSLKIGINQFLHHQLEKELDDLISRSLTKERLGQLVIQL